MARTPCHPSKTVWYLSLKLSREGKSISHLGDLSQCGVAPAHVYKKAWRKVQLVIKIIIYDRSLWEWGMTAHFCLPSWGGWMPSHSLNFPLCSARNHYDPLNVKWKETKNSCQAMYVILGKWEVERNSWISSFSFAFFPVACFLTFLWSRLFLPAHFLPSTCQWAQLRSRQVMTFRCRALWGSVTEKRRFFFFLELT